MPGTSSDFCAEVFRIINAVDVQNDENGVQTIDSI